MSAQIDLLLQSATTSIGPFLQSVPVPDAFPDSANPIDNILNFTTELSRNFAMATHGSFAGPLRILWRSMAIVYIAFLGWQVMFTGQFSAANIGRAILRIFIILVAVTQFGFINAVIVNVLFETPNQVGGRVVEAVSGGQTPDGISTALGAFWTEGFALAGNLFALEGAGLASLFTLVIPAGAIILATVLLTVAATILLVLATLALGILLGLAPFFIILAMFDTTRPFFEGWFRMVMNYALVPVFVYATVALAFFIAQPAFASISQELATIGALADRVSGLGVTLPDGLTTSEQEAAVANLNVWGSIGSLLLAGIVATTLMTQVLQMSASIAGGFALQSGRLIQRALTPARNVGRNLTNRLPGIGSNARRENRETRELSYLQRTQGLQRQLAQARGGTQRPSPTPTQPQPTQRAAPGTTGAGTPSGAVIPPGGSS